MPFMVGSSPVRRTLKYLESCKIIFRDCVKIFSVNYNSRGRHHAGAKDFVFWHLQQIQYKNPGVQCITFTNLTPSPFIKIYMEDGKNVLIDIDSRDKEDIVDHLLNFTAICKDQDKGNQNSISESLQKLACFGVDCNRHCMCEFPGQVPCPSLVRLPKYWRGIPNKNVKYRVPPHFTELGLDDDQEE